MRRSTTLLALVLALVAAACTDDPTTETATGDGPGATSASGLEGPSPESPATSEPPPSTTESPASTQVPDDVGGGSTTSTVPSSADDVVVEFHAADEDDLCGDWIPARVGEELTCRRPDTLPPAPVAHGTPWQLPVVDGSLIGSYGWHPPLALLNWDTVSLLTVDDPLSVPTVVPWARLDAWAEEIRIASDGTIVVAQFGTEDQIDEPEFWPFVEITVYPRDGAAATVLSNAEVLYDVGWHEGREVIAYAPRPGDPELPIRLAPLADLAATEPAFGPAAAEDWITTGLELEDEWAAVLGYLGNDSVAEIRAPDGSLWFRPFLLARPGDSGLDSAPALAISPDGTRITWVEYPADLFDDPDAFVRVKSADLVSGELVFDIPIENEDVGPTVEPVWSIVDLGDHVIVNTVGFWANRWWPNPALVLSFAADEPEWSTLPVTGIAVPVPYTVG